ncbi:MAG: bacteriohopanetetrol glucosamine biosynthesis glycosyltransferase HpnI [Gammaproteobacteria bacterium]|nr:bacteriohopanetetrol glucosamine biosynthesis glycosyltransferase HpnI [Gammaproteobacteria bacterium]
MAAWVLAWIGGLLLGGALTVLAADLVAVRVWRVAPSVLESGPPVSILKPLYGLEPDLYEILRTFCVQDYPCYEVVFGIQDAKDPAGAVVRRLQAEFPDRDLVLVVNDRLIGSNRKVCNLANILERARYGRLVLADADISVGPDYVRTVAAPLADAGVGIVTCLYRGNAHGGVWSRLGSLFIQDWFVPSVLLARLLGQSGFAFGATIALRRETLAAIGGFEAFASHLADDYEIGARTRALGLRTVLSPYVVTTAVAEPTFADLWAHQLRWLRTIRLVNPAGYAASVFSFALPVAAIGGALVGSAWAWACVFLALVLRLMLHWRACRRLGAHAQWGLWPVADLLLLALWVAGFLGRRVRWRDQRLAVGASGSIKASRE